MEKKILITCFEPFGGENFNASSAVASEMAESIGGLPTEKLTLPVEFGRAAEIAAARAIQTIVFSLFNLHSHSNWI